MLKCIDNFEKGEYMKVLISGNAIDYHEIWPYFDNYCKDLIIKELSKNFDNLE